MAEQATKLTRKEKIAQGIPKTPKRKKVYAENLKDKKADECRVTLRNYRSSARKMRLIVDQIRGREVFDALNVLKFTSKAAAPAVTRLLQSAIASYEEKFDERVDVDTHYVKEAMVDGSRMLKRLQPAPQGRAHIIRKRFCHVTLVIDEIPEQEEDNGDED
ncbi:MAG: 50S ribosomal protein L22 [Bacteroidia bacterium]|nr:50S ribosomal protein L22 [Bacteroidia bacterium]